MPVTPDTSGQKPGKPAFWRVTVRSIVAVGLGVGFVLAIALGLAVYAPADAPDSVITATAPAFPASEEELDSLALDVIPDETTETAEQPPALDALTPAAGPDEPPVQDESDENLSIYKEE